MLLEREIHSFCFLVEEILEQKHGTGDQKPHGHRPAGSISSGEKLPDNVLKQMKVVSTTLRADGTLLHHVIFTGKDGKRYATIVEMPPVKAAAVREYEKAANAVGNQSLIVASTTIHEDEKSSINASEDTHEDPTINNPVAEDVAVNKMSSAEKTRLMLGRFLLGIKNRRNPDNTILDKNGKIKDRNLDDGVDQAEAESHDPQVDTKDYLFGKLAKMSLNLPVIKQLLAGSKKALALTGLGWYAKQLGNASMKLAKFYEAVLAKKAQPTLLDFARFANGKPTTPSSKPVAEVHPRVSHHGSRGHKKYVSRDFFRKEKVVSKVFPDDFIDRAKVLTSGKIRNGPSYKILQGTIIGGKTKPGIVSGGTTKTMKAVKAEDFVAKNGLPTSAKEMVQNVERSNRMARALHIQHLFVPVTVQKNGQGETYLFFPNERGVSTLDSEIGQKALRNMNEKELSQLFAGRYLMAIGQRGNPKNTLVINGKLVDTNTFHGMVERASAVHTMNTNNYLQHVMGKTTVHKKTVLALLEQTKEAVSEEENEAIRKNLQKRAWLLENVLKQLSKKSFLSQEQLQEHEAVLRSRLQEEYSEQREPVISWLELATAINQLVSQEKKHGTGNQKPHGNRYRSNPSGERILFHRGGEKPGKNESVLPTEIHPPSEEREKNFAVRYQKRLELMATYNMGGSTPEEVQATEDKHIQSLLAATEPWMRRSQNGLQRILTDGKFKNAFETNTTGASIDGKIKKYLQSRQDEEQDLFGYNKETKPEERPFYGYVSEDPDGMNTLAASYGDVAIKLKPSIKESSTITFGDSMDSSGDPSVPNFLPVSYAKPTAKAVSQNIQTPLSLQKSSDVGYTEFQKHGGLSKNDIAEVVFYKSGPNDQLQQLLQKNGITYRVKV